MSSVKIKRLEKLGQHKRVGYFRMLDAPEPKIVKRKGKGKKSKGGQEVTQVCGPCPILPGVPIVPPTHVPQQWKLQRSQNITKEEEDDVIEGTSPKIIIPQRLFAQATQSVGTPPRKALESVKDITDATEEMCPSHHNMISGCSTVDLETVPPKTPPGERNIKIEFTPSTAIMQGDNIVPAEIDFLGFTPSCTTSTAAPGSDRSGNDSDAEIEYEENIASKPRNFADENPMDPSLAEAIRSIDAEADLALRAVLDSESDQDLLNFEWKCEPEHFEGVREVFTVPSPGPTFENGDLTPLDIFLKIWDADLIAHIVRETNRYGVEIAGRNQKPNSRLQRWKNVTDDEIKLFFAVIMLQSLVVNNVEREYWYPQLDELQIGNFKEIMPYNRFLVIKRCLHFADNASLPEHPNSLDKIMPIIERLNEKFSSLYLLEQNIAIDESLLLWKGRLSLSHKIATKKARVGIKSYELCESRTGYLWRMEVYSGKDHVHDARVGSQEPVEGYEEGGEPESATSQIVFTLMRPLFNRGHTLVMDSFYNAPLLSRILKVKHKTDSMGTLRLSREFVPDELRIKAKRNMKAGEVALMSTKDLSVVVWRDKSVVAMISTFHQEKVGGIEKCGNYKYKPQAILDYNLSMGGIDHKVQMLHAYPIERVRNITWYKKLFRRLLNVSIHNSFVLFNHNRTQVICNREFRLQLAKELLQTSRPVELPRSVVAAAPAAPSQMHLPAKNERRQRCKMCYAAKVLRTTMWRCSTCAVNLCIVGCYTDYHNQ